MVYGGAVASCAQIVSFLDELLDAGSFDDYGPNGLQVPGADDVSLVVTGVSAHLELFERAAALGADLVVCHHGLFWRNQSRRIGPALKARLRVLFEAEIGLAAYHLPLDAHPQVGNNALICSALGLTRAEAFGEAAGRAIGFVGRAGEALSGAELVDRCRATFGHDPLVFGARERLVERVGIVSGGGASTLGDAIELGLDALVTGEPSEPAMADARENGILFIAAGHYSTETLGVRRLGELLVERFAVEHRFVEARNPV